MRIIDFVDAGHSALLRMWERRQRGYRAMGYRVGSVDSSGELDYRGNGDDVYRKSTDGQSQPR